MIDDPWSNGWVGDTLLTQHKAMPPSECVAKLQRMMSTRRYFGLQMYDRLIWPRWNQPQAGLHNQWCGF